MTDERVSDTLGAAARLPMGSGIIFRHHETGLALRRLLFDRVRAIARKRRLALVLADTPARARAWGADGAHHRSMLRSRGLRTVAVHNRRELRVASGVDAQLVFVSPVFPTRSHPTARSLGSVRLGLMIGGARHHAVALGGMSNKNFKRLRGLGLHGWAAIDALS